MEQTLLKLLRELDLRIQPMYGGHHNLTRDYTEGGEEVLVLNINRDDGFWNSYYLYEGDIENVEGTIQFILNDMLPESA